MPDEPNQPIKRLNFWKVIAVLNILLPILAFAYIGKLIVLEIFYGGPGLVNLAIQSSLISIVEVPIFLSGLFLYSANRSWKKVIGLIAFTIQIILVLLFMMPSTRNQLTSKGGWDFCGNPANQSIKVETIAPPGIFKTDYAPPFINIKSPVWCTMFIGGSGDEVKGNVNFLFDANDDVGLNNVEAESVEIYIDGVLKEKFTSPPYEFVWDSRLVANGSHKIKAVATDKAGNSSNLTTSVQVSND